MIRPARMRDLMRLQQIERRAGASFRDLGMEAVAEDELPGLDWLAGFVAEGRAWVAVAEEDVAVAYLLASAVDGEALIEQVSVDPEHARRRLGRDLIEHAALWARARGLRALVLTTFDRVPWNRPYYERLGFTVVAAHDLSSHLREIRAGEADRGLDRWPRVVMRRALGGRVPHTSDPDR